MHLGVLSLYIHLPGSLSLKEKRSRLKPLITRLHREFNISVAEMDHQDAWQEASIACALISNDAAFTQRSLGAIPHWLEVNWPDIQILENKIEIL
jgi:uncharacterized protein YlxP (DUF503 family)